MVLCVCKAYLTVLIWSLRSFVQTSLSSFCERVKNERAIVENFFYYHLTRGKNIIIYFNIITIILPINLSIIILTALLQDFVIAVTVTGSTDDLYCMQYIIYNIVTGHYIVVYIRARTQSTWKWFLSQMHSFCAGPSTQSFAKKKKNPNPWPDYFLLPFFSPS